MKLLQQKNTLKKPTSKKKKTKKNSTLTVRASQGNAAVRAPILCLTSRYSINVTWSLKSAAVHLRVTAFKPEAVIEIYGLETERLGKVSTWSLQFLSVLFVFLHFGWCQDFCHFKIQFYRDILVM